MNLSEEKPQSQKSSSLFLTSDNENLFPTTHLNNKGFQFFSMESGTKKEGDPKAPLLLTALFHHLSLGAFNDKPRTWPHSIKSERFINCYPHKPLHRNLV